VGAEVVEDEAIFPGRSAGAKKRATYASKTSLSMVPSKIIACPISPRDMLAIKVMFFP
jgi:hypothetical protein